MPCYQIDKSKNDPNNISTDDGLKWIVSRDVNEKAYRLPTEAEWEYAAKGGIEGANRRSSYKYSGSNNANAVAWFSINSGGGTHRVGSKQSNELGLYDMSGNIWEWCHDWYNGDYYSISVKDNPTGPQSGQSRAFRGGGWGIDASDLCCTNRNYFRQQWSVTFIGFRCAR